MNEYLKTIIVISLVFISVEIFAQSADSTSTPTTFSGSIGITNNGFAIIPTFSLNSPATIINLAWRKKQFSLEPDIRLIPNLSKGGLLLWLRYQAIENNKFSLRLGAHPALSLVKRTVTDNGVNTEITEMLRFAAFEVVPNYQITKYWGLGAMFLNGRGLQKHGPQNTKVLFLNTNISNIKLTNSLKFHLLPMVYFLNTDGYIGNYFSNTIIISRLNSPFTLQSTINKTLKSDVPGNKDFMWNVQLNYNFSKKLNILKEQ